MKNSEKPISPVLSVCIPVYNCARFIGEAIQSVLSQDYIQNGGSFELIVIDNASTDGTLDVVRKFQTHPFGDCIRIEQNASNLGFCANWNLALTHAKGLYIKVLPADDFLLPGALSAQIKVLEDNPGIALVSGQRLLVNDNSKPIMPNGKLKGAFSAREALKKVLWSGGNPIGEPGAALFRQSAVSAGARFDGRSLFTIDLDFWFKLLKHGALYMIDKPQAAFRINAGSTSVNMVSRQASEMIAFAKHISNDPFYAVSSGTLLICTLSSYFKSLLRLIFYKVWVRA